MEVNIQFFLFRLPKHQSACFIDNSGNRQYRAVNMSAPKEYQLSALAWALPHLYLLTVFMQTFPSACPPPSKAGIYLLEVFLWSEIHMLLNFSTLFQGECSHSSPGLLWLCPRLCLSIKFWHLCTSTDVTTSHNCRGSIRATPRGIPDLVCSSFLNILRVASLDNRRQYQQF